VIDPKLLRTDPESVARNLARRGFDLDVTALKALEEKRKPWAVEVDRLSAERNNNAKAVGVAKGRGEDVGALIAKGESLTAVLSQAEAALGALQEELEQWQLGLPNLLHESVPDGRDEGANVEVRRWGEPRRFTFKPRDHVVVGEHLGGLDFEAAAPFPARASW
jgi:seryl-tRNA synthetase